MKILKVDWADAATRGGWGTIESTKDEKPTLLSSVGFEMQNTKEEIVLAQGLSHDSVLNITVIPKKWIMKIKELK